MLGLELEVGWIWKPHCCFDWVWGAKSLSTPASGCQLSSSFSAYRTALSGLLSCRFNARLDPAIADKPDKAQEAGRLSVCLCLLPLFKLLGCWLPFEPLLMDNGSSRATRRRLFCMVGHSGGLGWTGLAGLPARPSLTTNYLRTLLTLRIRRTRPLCIYFVHPKTTRVHFQRFMQP